VEDIARAARIAADPDAPARARVDALVQVVEAVSLRGIPIPDVIADAVDDVTLVDAAVALKRAGVVCAALHQLGPRPELESTRRRVVRRLIAAGASGTNLAALAFEIGDLSPAVTLATRDFEEHIAPRLGGARPNMIVDAWLGWLADQSDAAVTGVLRMLASRGAVLGSLLAHVSDARRLARLERLAGSTARS
jgi:hypothetical protein